MPLPPLKTQAGMGGGEPSRARLEGYAESSIRPLLKPLLDRMLIEQPDDPRAFLSQQLAFLPPLRGKGLPPAVPAVSSGRGSGAGPARGLQQPLRLPTKIIMVRHGQSQGNVDEKLYATTPDNQMPLSEAGKQQATEAGSTLRAQLGDSPFAC
eukprot:SAG22_NODE_2541_length_2462_cov_29.806602_4_plen_153_part_00